MSLRQMFACGNSSSNYVDDSAEQPYHGPNLTSSTSDFNQLDLAVHERNAETRTTVTKKSSFHSDNNNTVPTICSVSSNGSGESTTDSGKSNRNVTFRDKSKRVPKSVNATTSILNSSSTLSNEEEGDKSRIVTNALPTTTCSSSSFQSYSLLEKYGISPNPVKFAFLYGHHNNADEIQDSTSIEEDKDNLAGATSNMFTKEEIESITPLQISTYLSLDLREWIGTKVLCAKVKKGYTFSGGGSDLCEACSMPKLIHTKSNKVVQNCVVCPVLKKKVLKRILDGRGCQVREDQAFP